MSTIEKNILIAEFLGWEVVKYSTPNSDVKTPYGQISQDNLKFHSDWNWLIQVVEKIESLDGNIFKVEIYDNSCSIYDVQVHEMLFCFNCDSKISVTFEACVEFIQYYGIIYI